MQKCYICGCSNPTTLDHILPKKHGGPRGTNLAVCCQKCNSIKAAELGTPVTLIVTRLAKKLGAKVVKDSDEWQIYDNEFYLVEREGHILRVSCLSATRVWKPQDKEFFESLPEFKSAWGEYTRSMHSVEYCVKSLNLGTYTDRLNFIKDYLEFYAFMGYTAHDIDTILSFNNTTRGLWERVKLAKSELKLNCTCCGSIGLSNTLLCRDCAADVEEKLIEKRKIFNRRYIFSSPSYGYIQLKQCELEE